MTERNAIAASLSLYGPKRDLTKDLDACFYGNAEFPVPLKD